MSQPISALILKLTHPHFEEPDGALLAVATARLIYIPPDNSQPMQSHEYSFKAPINEIEQQEIRWYIES